jgi:hypothetical protein
MILKYKSSKKIQSQSDFHSDSKRIISNLKMLLKDLDARTESDENKIVFKQVLSFLQSRNNGPGTLIPLLDGEIQLRGSETEKIKLVWEIKLDTLFFFTMLLGVIAAFVSFLFLDTQWIDSIIAGVLTWIAVFIGWRQYIIFQIGDLIKTSCLM